MKASLFFAWVLLVTMSSSFGQGSVRRVPTLQKLLSVDPRAIATGDSLVYEVDAPSASASWGGPRWAVWSKTAMLSPNGTNVFTSPFGGQWVMLDRDDPIQNALWYGRTNVYSLDEKGNLVIGGTNVISMLATTIQDTPPDTVLYGRKNDGSGGQWVAVTNGPGSGATNATQLKVNSSAYFPTANLLDSSEMAWTNNGGAIYGALRNGSVSRDRLSGTATSYLLNRSNHTGTQEAATIFDIQDTIWAKIRETIAAGTGTTLSISDPSQIISINANQTFSATSIVSGTLSVAREGTGTADSSKFLRGDGAWSAIVASNVTAGTLATARLGGGLATVNSFLRGDGQWAVLTTNGTSVSITNTPISVNGVPYPSINLPSGSQYLWSVDSGNNATFDISTPWVWGQIYSDVLTTGFLKRETNELARTMTLDFSASGTPNATNFLSGSNQWRGITTNDVAGLPEMLLTYSTIVDVPPDTVLYGRRNSGSGGAWVAITNGASGSGATNATQLKVNGSDYLPTANLVDSSRIQWSADGGAVSADIPSGSVSYSRLSSGAKSSLLDRFNHTGTQTWATISDADDSVWEKLKLAIQGGTGIERVVSEVGQTITLTLGAHLHTGPDIASGYISTGRMGTGTPTQFTFLRGDGTWAVLTTNSSSVASTGSVFSVNGASVPVANLTSGSRTTASVSGTNVSVNVDTTGIGLLASGQSWSGTNNFEQTVTVGTDLNVASSMTASVVRADDLLTFATVVASPDIYTSWVPFFSGDPGIGRELVYAAPMADVMGGDVFSTRDNTFTGLNIFRGGLESRDLSGETTTWRAGWHSQATNFGATVTGFSSRSLGSFAVVYGYDASASAAASAFGPNAAALSTNGTSIGSGSRVSGQAGIAVGSGAIADGPNDIVVGSGSTSTGGTTSGNIILGHNSSSSATNSTVIGNGLAFGIGNNLFLFGGTNQNIVANGLSFIANGYARFNGNTTNVGNFVVGSTNVVASLAGKAPSSHAHAGSDITSGTVPAARLGSGSPTTNTFLRGDGSWATITTNGSVVTAANAVYVNGNYVTNLTSGANSAWSIAGQSASIDVDPTKVGLLAGTQTWTGANQFNQPITAASDVNVASSLTATVVQADDIVTFATVEAPTLGTAWVPFFSGNPGTGRELMRAATLADIRGAATYGDAYLGNANVFTASNTFNSAISVGTDVWIGGTNVLDAVALARPSLTSSRLLGRGGSSGTGVPESIRLGASLYMTGTELGVRDQSYGDIDVADAGSQWTVHPASLTFSKMQNISAGKLMGRTSVSSGSPQEVAVDLPLSMSGAHVQIADGSISTAKIANTTTNSILLGRGEGVGGPVQELHLGTGLSVSGTTINASVSSGNRVTSLKTATFSASNSSDVLMLDFAEDGDMTLPTNGSVSDGHTVTAIRIGGGVVTVKNSAGDTIDTLNAAGSSRTWIYYAAGSRWYLISSISGS